MKTSRRLRSSRPVRSRAFADLRSRLAESEETLRAIQTGKVDTVVVVGKLGRQVFTLDGAEHAYRVLIESMNEGALTLTAGKMILYANERFARMVNCPLEQVLGSSFRRFLSHEDLATLRTLMKRAGQSGFKIQLQLSARGGLQLPVQISVRRLPKNRFGQATLGMVVTDLTEARRTEEMLRALSRRLVHAQEAERRRVALELHDDITQHLCAVLLRFQVLADKLSARHDPLKGDATKLQAVLGEIADDVERISRNLRPGVMDGLGLVAVLRETIAEFADRTGVSVKLACTRLSGRLSADIELTLYRILQEALENVLKHACARHITVCLSQQASFVQLSIRDDGIGFDPNRQLARRKGKGGLNLFTMRERAAYVGGTLQVKSAPGNGTIVRARIPIIDRVSERKRCAQRVR